MDWNGFLAIPNGQRVYNNGWDQCVALGNLYHESVLGGSFVPVASAYQWWTDYSRLPQLQNIYFQVSVYDAPKAGDVYLARGGIYNSLDGHIGVVVRDWDGATFGTKEQNAELNRYVYQTYNRGKANVLGFLRPRVSPIPKPIIDESDDEMYGVAVIKNGPAYLWNMASGQYKWIDVDWQYTMFAKNFKRWDFNSESDFKAFREKYPFVLPTGAAGTVNVSAIAKAVNDDAARRMGS